MEAVADVGMLGSVFQCSLCSFITMEQVSSVNITAQLNQPHLKILKNRYVLPFVILFAALRSALCALLSAYAIHLIKTLRPWTK
jgi:hypothetical protein